VNDRNTVERAFELARSGAGRDINEIRLKLKQEGHDSVDAHLGSGALRRQLRDICAEAAQAHTGAKGP
jgi:hypothetical protein